ncbi:MULTISPECIES: carbohydrate-binding module family 20 domain-containing protein [Nocardiopsis]|uniref:Alpha-amylase n=1 Tax=Nocardiopsis sinuspersici TaxID=501010 RepID=A0A1V3BYI3_9ACTN|nr:MULTISPECIES: carbohydrate-binding module family 20 domain-containing protein [Nocardiopsis]OOC53190.1 alpha-amylase [Nocardiopsis sinuspersici]
MKLSGLGAAAGSVLVGAGLLAVPLLPGPAPRQIETASTDATAAATGNGEAVVHLFQWTWDAVANECTDFLGPRGFGAVKVSPPQEHVVIPYAEGGNHPWWQDYQPVSYRIDNTRRGTAEEFEAMVSTCADSGVKVYVDAVINHMTGDGSGTGSAGTEWAKYDHPDLFGDGGAGYDRADFGPCYEEIADWNDKWEVQNCQLVGLADLDTADPRVRAQIRRYLNDLVDMGVAGFRVDAAKHVPEEHIGAILSDLHEVPVFGGRPEIYQEVIGDQTIPYTAYTPYGDVTAFDYQRDISGRFANGDISGLAHLPDYGGLSDEQATVFIDNHDSQRYHPTLTFKDGDRYYLATAFMLAHPYGTPVVMSSYDFGDNVTEGPPSTGSEPGNPAGWITEDADCSDSEWVCEHRHPAVAGMAAFRNATGDTPVVQRATDGASRLAFDRGDRGFAAFNASGGTWNLTADTALPDGSYENAAGSGTLTVADGRVSARVPANGAVALHVGGTCDDSAECGGGTDPGDPDDPAGSSVSATVETWYGQEVYVVGSTPELGSWNPLDGVRLSTDESTYPVWSGTVPFGADTEWKLVKVDGAGNAEWESGANRVGPASTVTWRD